jgi:hypothetical protein
VLVGACIASAPEGIHRQTDQDAGADVDDFIDAGLPDGKGDVESSDPHAVFGADPAHGPFQGGQRVLVRGKAFTSNVRVWFGDAEVDPTTMVPVDPTRVQVTAPPGTAGPVDLSVQNGDDASTKRTLAAGYVYDALYAVPSEGPVSGGTVIELVGQNTAWDETTVVTIDQKPCSDVKVTSATALSCTTPKGTPGSKPIGAKTGAESIIVLDAFTYADSDNGYKGGLSGSPLAGTLKVLVYDNFTGDPVPAAYVVVGDDVATALIEQADATGVAIFDDPSLDAPRTVTVAAKCHSPISFVDVPVDTVTAYLDPVATPDCAGEGDPPPVGGKSTQPGLVSGELVWPTVGEFKKGPWLSVPEPASPNERKVAYLFVAAADPTQPFQLPPGPSAVTEDSPGDAGYSFVLSALPGNRALYALAGIEDDSVMPPKFTAYVLGMVKGIPVLPGDSTDSVYIQMDHTLDQALTMDVAAPGPGPKGPDRLRATSAVMLGNDGYAILPAGQKEPLLPLQGDVSFIGVPALNASLLGASYVSTARAVTGPTYTAPMSIVGRILSNTTSQVVTIEGFVGLPTLVTPPLNGSWDGTHLATTFGQGAPIDLSVYDIAAGNGLVRWTVVVPKGSHSIALPDLAGFEQAHLPPGPLTLGIYGARVDAFDYAKLRYRDFKTQGMSAYALDYFPAHL